VIRKKKNLVNKRKSVVNENIASKEEKMRMMVKEAGRLYEEELLFLL
jgi:hypothetical protein